MLVKKDPSTFANYLADNSGLTGGYAEKVVFPQTEEEAVEILRQVQDSNSRLTISGAGTGVVGGRVPFGGVVLSTESLNKIREIVKFKGKPGGKAVVEPGVRLADLKQEAEKLDLAYLPDPTEKNAVIGGTVGTNASGARGFKYGSTRDHISALKVILPGGYVLAIKRGQFILKDVLYIELSKDKIINCPLPNYTLPKTKNAAGYFIGQGADLIDLFIGQEGTLGLVSEIEVKLGQRPVDSFLGLVFFDDTIDVLNFVNYLKEISYLSRKEKKKSKIDTVSLEYFDYWALEMLRTKFPQIPKNKQAAVYFDQDITQDEDKLEIMQSYSDLMEKLRLEKTEIWFAESKAHKEQLNNLRYDLPVMVNERIIRNGFPKISTDIAVSGEEFLAMFDFYKAKLEKTCIPYCLFGHIGENHLHLNLMPENKNEFVLAKDMYMEFITKAVRLGGTISAEHGIGKLKREYFKIMVGEAAILEMAKVKRLIDPKLILGIGNIFSEELLEKI